VAIMLALALVVAVFSLAQSDLAGSQTKSAKRSSFTVMSSYEIHLAVAINIARKRHGLRPLELVPGLMRSAGKHSLQMAYVGYFSHSSANGASFYARVGKFYGGGSPSQFSAGENIYWTQPRVKPRGVVWRWLGSPGHRRILLSSCWRVFGLGVVKATHGPGVFRGRKVMLVTADFAVKR
jgi:uncharacterized protein YkwD